LTNQTSLSRFQYVPSKPEPAPLPGAAGAPSTKKKTTKTTTVEYEVLNPKSVASSSTPPPPEPEEGDEVDEDDAETVPEMTPVIAEFSKLPLKGFQESWDFIKAHRDVVVPGASDALLVAGYRAEREGKRKYAKQCVHQSLLLQYGEKLGSDGVSIFFTKSAFFSGLFTSSVD
jgi:cell division cycle protein 37